MVKIPVCRNYKSLSEIADREQQLFIAEEAVLAGEGSGGVGTLPTTMTFDAMQTHAVIAGLLSVGCANP